jgi:hypothetical protein
MGGAGGALDHLGEFGGGGERHERLEEETVELRLGQRVRALHLDRVHRCHDEERAGQGAGLAGHGHGPLRHRLQQRRLCLRRCPVDLVGQHQLCEHRARPVAELAPTGLVLLEDVGADDVGRHQVRRELQPGERQVQRLGQRLEKHRLAQPRYPLDERMPFAHKADEHEPHEILLPDNDAPHLRLDGGRHFGIGLGSELVQRAGLWRGEGGHSAPRNSKEGQTRARRDGGRLNESRDGARVEAGASDTRGSRVRRGTR